MPSRANDPAARQDNETIQAQELIRVLERKLEERSAELLPRTKEWPAAGLMDSKLS
jgi:hypothetical protein